MVIAENQYGSMAPTMSPANWNGWRMSTLFRPTVVTKAPNSARETKAAEPTGNRNQTEDNATGKERAM
jgi:hypothetical protein